MAVMMNLKGTMNSSFQLGKRGPTISQGSALPNNSNGVDGDIYFRYGATSATYQKVSGSWVVLQVSNSKLQDLSGVAHSANSFLGSDGTNIILRSASQSRTALGLGTAALVDTGLTSGTIPLLGPDGKLPESVLPSIAISEVNVVADNAERDALVVQSGDFAVVTSTGQNYVWSGTAWIEITRPESVTSVAGKTGNVTLDASDIISGVFTAARGGTGLSNYSKGDILFANTTSSLNNLPIGIGGTFLKSNGVTPEWSSVQASEVTFAPNTVQRLSSTNVQDAISELADERSFTHVSATNPNYAHDSSDTAGIGIRFKVGDAWLNSVTKVFYYCSNADVNSAEWVAATASGIFNVVEDTTPELGGNLDTKGFSIVTSNNANLVLSPSGSGQIVLSGNYFPNSVGSAGQILKADGAGNLLWGSDIGEANVAAPLGTSADGVSLVGDKDGVILNFKRIKAGTNVTIDEAINGVTISSSNPTTGANLGIGSSLYAGKSGDELQFRKLKSGANITVSEGSDEVTIAVQGLSTVATSGSYVDLSNVPSLSTVATSGDYTDLVNTPSLGTASSKNVGTSEGDIPLLGIGGKLPSSVIPALAISSVDVVADISARDALVVESGDVAKVTSTGQTFIYDGSAWIEMSSPDAIQSVNGETGVVVLDASDIDAARTAINYTPAGSDLKAHLDAVDTAIGTKANTASLALVATSGAISDTSGNLPATRVAGLADVALSGDYTDLANKPSLGTAAMQNVEAFATASQGALADSAVQPGSLSVVATTGEYADLLNKPVLGTAASKDVGTAVGNVPVVQANGKLDRNLVNNGYAGGLVLVTEGTTTTLTVDDHLVFINKALGGSHTVNLPDGEVVGVGKLYTIKDSRGSSSTSPITVVAYAPQTIDGQATQTIQADYESITVVWNGSHWNII